MDKLTSLRDDLIRACQKVGGVHRREEFLDTDLCVIDTTKIRINKPAIQARFDREDFLFISTPMFDGEIPLKNINSIGVSKIREMRSLVIEDDIGSIFEIDENDGMVHFSRERR